ncbi:MAG TPA: ABC transporter ATP-binding protein [Nakamurella sp.]
MTITQSSGADLRSPDPGDPAIEIRGLVKRYAGQVVVNGLDLRIEPGECFALLGPNGAGKTTTIEILEGFRRRDAGEVSVLGVDPARADRRWRARIGVVAQSTGDSLALSVREVLDAFGHYHRDPVPTAELISAVGLQEKAGTRINALSGGQRRRLDVALGIQGRPDLLLLDEPTTGLDPAARRTFWQLVEELKRAGTTIVLTTHYLDEAATLADRVGVIDRGWLREVAPPGQLGGRLRGTATVRWTENGVPREIVTESPTEVLRDLLARHPDGELDELQVHRPTLEDVYLRLIEQTDATEGADR